MSRSDRLRRLERRRERQQRELEDASTLYYEHLGKTGDVDRQLMEKLTAAALALAETMSRLPT